MPKAKKSNTKNPASNTSSCLKKSISFIRQKQKPETTTLLVKAMKTTRTPLIPLGIAVMLVTPCPAIETPADTAPPPPAAAAPMAPVAPNPVPDAAAQVAPYLGVGTSHVPEALAAHIGLKADEGILIRAVDPDGPAAKAGLAEHDVITRVAGQAVGSHADLVKQIQGHKAGDAIALDLIHQGKAINKAVTLATRPDGGGIAATPPELDNLMLNGMPQEQAKRIRDAINRQLRAMQDGGANPDDLLGKNLPNMADAVQEMQKHMADAMKNGIQLQGGDINGQGGAVFRMQDEQGSIEMKSVDGGKEATVRDNHNKVLWSGPWDTPQDKAAAPANVRARLDKLNIDNTFEGNGIRLHFGAPGGIIPKAAVPAEPAPDDAPDE
jgi:hypothetical protein